MDDDAKGLGVSFKAIGVTSNCPLVLIPHQRIQALLRDVAERWVAKIVGEGGGFAGVGVYPCLLCCGPLV